jgi:hypothetical protein
MSVYYNEIDRNAAGMQNEVLQCHLPTTVFVICRQHC